MRRESAGPSFSKGVDTHDWDSIGYRRYQQEYMLPLKPVVIKGALKHWRALGKWTPEYFRDNWGAMKLEIKGQAWTMADLVDRVLVSTPQSPAPYLQQHHIDGWPAELLADVSPLPQCTRPNWVESRWFPSRYQMKSTEFFLGGPGAKFPFLHFDHWHMHAFLMQVCGVKEYIAFAPDQTPYMYANDGDKENISSVDEIDTPDLQKFPLFAKARGIKFLLQPGETLYVPSGWWHTARILSPSITISINGANAANWSAFRKDMLRDHAKRSPARAMALAAYFAVFERVMP